MKIWDCFMFFDELMLLEVRLKELDSVVDKFVLVEAPHTFSGIPKKLYYDDIKDNDIFSPYKDKIIHVVYDKPPISIRKEEEYLQRNYISVGLQNAKPDDIVIITDLDEIVDSLAVPLMESTNIPTRLEMKFFYYAFNCRVSHDWLYPVFCRYRDFTKADDLRLSRDHKTSMTKAGWHFSYLFPVEKISEKLSAFSHTEYDTDYYKDVDRLRNCVENNVDIFNRPDMAFTIEPLDAPQCVMEDQEKYKEYIK